MASTEPEANGNNNAENASVATGADSKVAEEAEIIYKTLKIGDGTHHPEKGDTVRVHYFGRLEDGTVFDSSRDRNTPLQAQIGNGQLIPGNISVRNISGLQCLPFDNFSLGGVASKDECRSNSSNHSPTTICLWKAWISPCDSSRCHHQVRGGIDKL